MGVQRMARLVTAGLVGVVAGVSVERWRSSGAVRAATVMPTVPSEVDHRANRSLEIMKFGFPSTENIRVFEDFVLSYDRRNRMPHWVFEHLTRDSVERKVDVDRSSCEFKEDPQIHDFFRSRNADYLRSGYDRGHLAAAGNHRRSLSDMQDTFHLSNIAPQVGKGFNRDIWNRLEKHVRRLTKHYLNVYVCTGPLYLPRREPDGKLYVRYEVIGKDHVAVPTHFFKVVVGETETHEYDLEAYVMENKSFPDETPISAFLVDVQAIERSAGLLLFDRLPRETFRKINHRG